MQRFRSMKRAGVVLVGAMSKDVLNGMASLLFTYIKRAYRPYYLTPVYITQRVHNMLSRRLRSTVFGEAAGLP